MYRIEYDPHDEILRLTLEGFWNAATLARFTAEILIRTAPLKFRRRSFGTLSDARAFPVQSPMIADALARLMARGTEMNAGPTAIVVSGALNKMQAERTLDPARSRVFLDPDEARSWLVAAMAPVAA